MSQAFQIKKQEATYFLTPTAVEWADAFMRKEHKDILCDCLNFCVDQKGLEIFSYVIMTSHMHMVARAKNNNLSDIMRDFKRFTSRKLLYEYNNSKESRRNWMLNIFKEGGQKQKKKSNNQLWQYNSHAIEIYSPKFFRQKINYIHNNPVVAGLVSHPHEYRYSSAQDYAGRTGPVKVSVVDQYNLV